MSEDNRLSILDKYRYKDEDSVTANYKISKRIKNVSPKKKKITVLDPTIYMDLPPSLDNNCQVVFVGYNPGLQSSIQQHHYAHFTNLFWKLFNQSNILLNLIRDVDKLIEDDKLLKKIVIRDKDNLGSYKSILKPEDDFDLVQYKIGFTDLLLRCTKSAQELTKEEKLNNVPRLISEFRSAEPRFIVLVGKGIWECIIEYIKLELNLKLKKLDKNSPFQWGRQDTSSEDNDYDKILQKWQEYLGYENLLYVLPNTSGLVASLKYEEKLSHWQELARDIKEFNK